MGPENQIVAESAEGMVASLLSAPNVVPVIAIVGRRGQGRAGEAAVSAAAGLRARVEVDAVEDHKDEPYLT